MTGRTGRCGKKPRKKAQLGRGQEGPVVWCEARVKGVKASRGEGTEPGRKMPPLVLYWFICAMLVSCLFLILSQGFFISVSHV